MGTPGRPPVPLERKKKLGHLREDRIPGGQAIELSRPEGELEPPESLGPEGLQVWEKVTAAAPWLWNGVDDLALQILCEQIDERVELRGLVMSGEGSSRDRSALRALEKQIAGNLSLLGFTPSDRARLGLIQASRTEKSLKLEEMMRRAEQMNR